MKTVIKQKSKICDCRTSNEQKQRPVYSKQIDFHESMYPQYPRYQGLWRLVFVCVLALLGWVMVFIIIFIATVIIGVF